MKIKFIFDSEEIAAREGKELSDDSWEVEVDKNIVTLDFDGEDVEAVKTALATNLSQEGIPFSFE